MFRLSTRSLIATASAFIGLGERAGGSEGGGTGGLVELVRREVGQSGHGAWDTALVHHLGYWSHFDHRSQHSSWPLIATASATELGAFGAERKIEREEPEPGDVFLLYAPNKRQFVRAGIIVALGGRGKFVNGNVFHEVVTIEGNTNERGHAGGDRTLAMTRKLSWEGGDRFLRWTDLDPYLAAGDPTRSVDSLGGRLVVRKAA